MPTPSPDTSVREAILPDPYLTVEQKHTLLTVYESFVAQRRSEQRPGRGSLTLSRRVGQRAADGRVQGARIPTHGLAFRSCPPDWRAAAHASG